MKVTAAPNMVGKVLDVDAETKFQVAANGPNIVGISETMTVPFTAYRLRDARVVWLNERWLAQQGHCEIGDTATADSIERWLLERYAFATPSDSLAPGALSGEATILRADRYGGPAGSDSGGSGRCGIWGDFNVKGCGATPLVGRGVSWMHSHGCLWLEEAIREAIYSEIAVNSFPHSAIPVVAIIDAGTSYIHNGPNLAPIEGARRALSIRPNFLRPASLQRSILFGSAGTTESDQYLDAERVRSATRAFLPHCGADEGRQAKSRVQSLFLKLARQVGSGWANRLSHDFFASNLTLDGQLVDFGNFRALPSWRRTEYFGGELRLLAISLEAISFYARKYAGIGMSPSEKETLIKEMQVAARMQFIHEAQQVADSSTTVADRLPQEFSHLAWQSFCEYQQQGTVPSATRSIPWMGRAQPLAPSARGSAAATQIATLYSQSTASSPIRRWLKPKPVWYRETVLRLSQHFCTAQALGSPGYRQSLGKFIEAMASRYRPSDPSVPCPSQGFTF